MVEFEQDNSRPSKIIQIFGIIFCLVLIAGLSFGLIFIKHEQRKFVSEIEETVNLIEQENENINLQNENIETIKKEIEENSNVLKLTEDQKAQYPLLASKLEEEIKSGNVDAKIAYLTFDDGPYQLTDSYLDVLDEYDVRATFFCLEKNETYGFDEETSQIYDATYQRIINSGHTLGNHTASHNIKRENNGIYNSIDNFMNDIIENRNFIYNNYGYTTTIMRFPGGSSITKEDKDEFVEAIRKENYGYVDWNSETGDGNALVSAEQSAENVLNTTNNRSFLVVLMHDYSKETLDALPNIITGLRKQGYILLPLFYDSIMVNK